MKPEQIVTHSGVVVLLGATSDATARRDLADLLDHEGLAEAPLVAADGGADLARACNLTPRAIIGDLDSLSEGERRALPSDRLHPIAEQETTDFDKALRSITAPVVLAVGFHGGRLDHQLAVLTGLTHHPDRRCILVGPEDITCLCPPRIALDLPVESRLSLFPMAEVTGTSQGLHWPIDGLTFRPDARIATSNRVADKRVCLSMDRPGMLLILPRPALRPLLAALSRSDARWPARAG